MDNEKAKEQEEPKGQKAPDKPSGTDGVFWLVGENLLTFPFDKEKYPEAIAKSGNTYNHEKLWELVKPKGCGKPFDYYPRGRAVISNSGTVTVYMSPEIPINCVSAIEKAFGIKVEYVIKYDNSRHYRCYSDD